MDFNTQQGTWEIAFLGYTMYLVVHRLNKVYYMYRTQMIWLQTHLGFKNKTKGHNVIEY